MFFVISRLLILPTVRLFDHISEVRLDIKINPKMPRTKSKAVSECNVPVPQEESGLSELTMAEMYQRLKYALDKTDKHLETLTGEIRKTNQCLAGLQF